MGTSWKVTKQLSHQLLYKYVAVPYGDMSKQPYVSLKPSSSITDEDRFSNMCRMHTLVYMFVDVNIWSDGVYAQI